MRLPYIISPNTAIAYETAPVMRDSPGEAPRTCTGDDLKWGDGTIPKSLVEICIELLATIFERVNPLNSILKKDVDHLMELFPDTIDLKYSAPLIQDEEYWKRCFLKKWPFLGDTVGDSWKGSYLSATLREYLETEKPNVFNLEKAIALAKLCQPYVVKLSLSQLEMCYKVRPLVSIDETEVVDTCEFSVKQCFYHVPLEKVLVELNQLQEVCLVFGVNNLQTRYEERYFEFAQEDIESLCNGLQKLPFLRILRINRSKLDCKKASQLLRCLFETNLEVLDLAHCWVGDNGTRALAGFIKYHHAVRIVNFANNRFGDVGCQGLAYAIQSSPKAPLEELDLRLNRFSLKATLMLCAAFVRAKEKPVKLSLSACGFRGLPAEKLMGLISLNRGLRELDFSANDLSGETEISLIEALKQNQTLLRINLQNTKISEATQVKVNQLLSRNETLAQTHSVESQVITPLYLNEPEYLVWEYNPNNPDYIPGIYPERIAEA